MRIVLFLVDLSSIIVDTHSEVVLFLVDLSSIIVDTHSEDSLLFLVDKLSSIIVDTHSEGSPVSSRFVFYYCRYTQ